MGSSNVVQLNPGETFSTEQPINQAGKVIVDPGATSASTQARGSIETYELDILDGGSSVNGVPLTSSDQSRREYVTAEVEGKAVVEVTNTGSTTGFVLVEVRNVNEVGDIAGQAGTVLLSQELRQVGIERLTRAVDAQGHDISNVGALGTDKGNIKNTPATYELYTDGAEIAAIPQQNPDGPSLSTYTAETDLSSLLTTLITDELPPQGTEKEAAGKIKLKRGDYPGPNSLTMVPLPTSCWIEGEIWNHIRDDVTNPSTPETINPTRLNNIGFRPANVDGDDSTFPRVSNLMMYGPGQTATGSRAFDSEEGSNLWDWLVVENVVMQYYERLVNYKSGEFMKMRNCHGLWFSDKGVDIGGVGGRTKMADCSWFTDADTRSADIGGGQAINCRFSSGASNGTPVLEVKGGGYVAGGTTTTVGSPSSPYGVRMTGSGGSSLVMGHNIAADFAVAFDMSDTGGFATVALPKFTSGTAPSTHFRINGATDPNIVMPTTMDVSVGLVNGPTRPRWNGIIGGGPLGGVNLGNTTAQFDGDVAMADGTTGTEYLTGRADTANTQWVLSDGTTVQY